MTIDAMRNNSTLQGGLPFLQPGDVVEIVAPAARCHPNILVKVQELTSSWGLECQVSENIFGEDLLCANSVDQRLEQLVDALTNSRSKLVWCLLGGYGSSKLIPFLDKMKPINQTKFFMGFSDITALHIFLQEKWGWSTIHGPSARQAALKNISSESIDRLKNFLFHQTTNVSYPLQALNTLATDNATITAPIIGGNLHLIQASIGTFWQINPKDKILFIEDVNERAYRIDRVFEHLYQAQIMENIKAILIGDFIGGEEADGSSLVEDTLKQFAAHCKIPALRINDIGHGVENYPLPLGQKAKLYLGTPCKLSFE